jgi:hypothetical protein
VGDVPPRRALVEGPATPRVRALEIAIVAVPLIFLLIGLFVPK